MSKEIKKISFIGKMDEIKKSMEIYSHLPISVSDKNKNKVVPASEEPYPFLPDNVFAVHNPMLYKMFTLDINQDGIFPTDFIEAYGNGFKVGLQFLESEKINIDQLDDENRKTRLLDRLKRILHERKFEDDKTILSLVVGTVKGWWTDEKIFEVGRLNGIITAIDQFAERAGLDEKDLGKEKTQASKTENQVDPKTYTRLWFKSGLLFADGTMDKYWNDRNDGIKPLYSAPDITKEVNIKGAREYILGVFNNYDTDKNFFNYPDKIKTILEYCENKDITVSDIFSKKHAQKLNEYK